MVAETLTKTIHRKIYNTSNLRRNGFLQIETLFCVYKINCADPLDASAGYCIFLMWRFIFVSSVCDVVWDLIKNLKRIIRFILIYISQYMSIYLLVNICLLIKTICTVRISKA